MLILGVDPGIKGAIALYDGTDINVIDMPSIKAKSRGNEIVWSQLADDFIKSEFYMADHAYIEQVGAMPGQGVVSMFKFGYAAGGIRGIIAANQIPVTLVTPPVWKKFQGLIGFTKKAKSAASRARASDLFPSQCDLFKRVKDDGRAEAALIAHYGYYKLLGDKQ